jgi:DNA (cytosine-5)-methyltransferase 1
MQTYRCTDLKVGKNKGAPRVWLEGQRLAKAGFSPGQHYHVDTGHGRVVLTIQANGARVVSVKKRNDRQRPVIDLNSAKDLGLFEGLEKIRVIVRKGEIHLLPLASQLKARERLERVERKIAAKQPLTVGSLCHGGGVLSLALHKGMKAEGVATELGFANDIDPTVLDHASEHNPAWSNKTVSVAAPMQELMTDDWLIKQLGTCEILEAGIPCVAASLSGRAKKGLKMAEEDPNAGHLVVPFLAIVQAVQPALILVENVPPYQNTASAHLIRNTLRDWGYSVHETVLAAGEFGALENRKRMALVAVTAGLAFDASAMAPPHMKCQSTVGEILEDMADDARCWSEMGYLRDKEARDRAAGKGFRMQILGPADTQVGTIGADYQKNRSTEPKLRHPTKGDALLRLFTPIEHARIKGIPESVITGLPATRAHKLLGNSICFEPFVRVGKAIARTLNHQPRQARTAMPDAA